MIYKGLLLFFLLEYVRPGMFIPALNATRINSIVPIAIFIATFFASGGISNKEAFAESNTKKIGMFIGLIVVSVLTADVTEFAYNIFMVVIGYAMVFWVITKRLTKLEELRGVFMAMVLVHVMVAALTPEMFTGSERQYVASGSFLGDGNDFALSVNIVIPMCLFLVSDAKKTIFKLFWMLALFFLIIAVVATQSRGGTVALVAVGLYYWAKSPNKGRTAAFAVVAVLLVFAFAPPEYFARMHDVANSEEGSAQGRIEAWKASGRMAADHPILGVGAGHFAVAYGSKYKKSEGGPWRTAHSIYFLTLGELGLPGVFVLLSLIFGNLAANRKVFHEARNPDERERLVDQSILAATSAAMLAYATGGAFLSAIYYPHQYIVAGLLVAARRIVRGRQGQATSAPAPAVRVLDHHPAMRRLPPQRRLA